MEPSDEVVKEVRQKPLFDVVYGSRQTGEFRFPTKEEAEKMIESFYRTYPGLKTLIMEQQTINAERTYTTEYVATYGQNHRDGFVVASMGMLLSEEIAEDSVMGIPGYVRHGWDSKGLWVDREVTDPNEIAQITQGVLKEQSVGVVGDME